MAAERISGVWWLKYRFFLGLYRLSCILPLLPSHTTSPFLSHHFWTSSPRPHPQSHDPPNSSPSYSIPTLAARRHFLSSAVDKLRKVAGEDMPNRTNMEALLTLPIPSTDQPDMNLIRKYRLARQPPQIFNRASFIHLAFMTQVDPALLGLPFEDENLSCRCFFSCFVFDSRTVFDFSMAFLA